MPLPQETAEPGQPQKAESIVDAKRPAQAESVADSEGFGVLITVQEGRFHQIKRMAKAVGREVLYLKRLSMGSLRLDAALRPGEYRPLTEEEIESLKRSRKETAKEE